MLCGRSGIDWFHAYSHYANQSGYQIRQTRQFNPVEVSSTVATLNE
jgi:hypothetical protein